MNFNNIFFNNLAMQGTGAARGNLGNGPLPPSLAQLGIQ